MAEQLDVLLSPLGLSARALLIMLAAAGIGVAVAFVLVAALGGLAHFDRARLGAAIATRCRKVLVLLLPVIGISIVSSGLAIEPPAAAVLPRVLSIVTIALAGWLAICAVQGFVDHVIATHGIDHADNLEERRMQTQIRLLGRVAVFVVLVATVAGALMSIPSIRNVGVSLFASAGIAGLAIGLAARPALSNLIAGIQIAMTQPIRLEDAVVVEGEWGWVEEINMTFVVIRIWDLRRLILPISYFIEQPFQNWTRNNADILGAVMLHVDYRVPVDDIRAEFARALRANEQHWDGKVEVVHVTDSTDRAVQVRLLMSAGTSPAAWELRCAVREHMLGWLQREHPELLPRLRVENVE